MRLVLFCGSLGAGSSNRALLDVVERRAVESGWTVSSVQSLDQIPIFDPGVVDQAVPEAVTALRDLFESADAVVAAVPEYAGGAAGGAKNALDWMVGSGSLDGRVAAVLCAGTTGGPNAVGQIARTLAWQGAHVVAALGVAAPSTKRDAEGQIVDAETLRALGEVVSRVHDATHSESRRGSLTAETLRRLAVPLRDRNRQ